jgi:FkbM family methyltransferase
MKLLPTVRGILPERLRKWLRMQTLVGHASRALSPYLPEMVCIDVGASFFPHAKWAVFLDAPKTRWLAVDPNEATLNYTKTWPWRSRVTTLPACVSGNGGPQTLFVTNVVTGSSLLPLDIRESVKHRFTQLDYFFPIHERKVDTLTLEEVVSGVPRAVPLFLKLDTQGTELSILRGAPTALKGRRVVGLEMEATMLAEPVMKGAGKFWEAYSFLEEQGFELLHVTPIAAGNRRGKHKRGLNTFLNECDAVFSLRRDVVAGLAVEFRIGLLAFYLTNRFFEEGLSLLSQDIDVYVYLREAGCKVDKLHQWLDARSQ